MSINKFSELEYKFNADEIKLNDFVKLMESLGNHKHISVSSWDHYFVSADSENSFQRFRDSDTPELTKKIKTKDSNNWQRIEVDLPLDPKRIDEETVRKYVELDNYKFNFKIYKNCFIYVFDKVNYVYYLVFDENMKERGRFLEVEVNKHGIETMVAAGTNPETELDKASEELRKLGLTPQNRLKRSLYEMFVK